MAVLRLAFINVLRRLSRSILALMAMAIAAAVLTSGLSMSKGVPRTALETYREYFKGDIIVFTPGFIGAGPLQESQETVIRRSIIDSGFNRLAKYYPMLKDGYYAQEHWEDRPLSSQEIEEIQAAPGIGAAVPYHVMPATLSGDALEFTKPHAIELKSLPTVYFPRTREYKGVLPYDIEVVLNHYGAPKANIDDIVEISIPYYQVDQHGVPYVGTETRQETYKARVVGHVAMPTRSIVWTDAMGSAQREDGFVHSPEVFLLEEVWQEIWATHTSSKYPVFSLGLTVDNMSDLRIVAQHLRESFPHLAFFPIPDLVDHVNRFALLDKFYRAPAYAWQGEVTDGSNPLAHQDFGMVTATLLFMNAGMLLASQMLASVAGRRNEIGILKAIGARQWEVVGMILVEATILALIGATVGFAMVRLAAIHQSLTNGIPVFQVIKTTLQEQGLVFGMTMGASLVFGVLPAWKVSRLTVMDVFRNE